MLWRITARADGLRPESVVPQSSGLVVATRHLRVRAARACATVALGLGLPRCALRVAEHGLARPFDGRLSLLVDAALVALEGGE